MYLQRPHARRPPGETRLQLAQDPFKPTNSIKVHDDICYVPMGFLAAMNKACLRKTHSYDQIWSNSCLGVLSAF